MVVANIPIISIRAQQTRIAHVTNLTASVFANDILLKRNHICSFICCLLPVAAFPRMAELSSQDRDNTACKLKIFTIWPFTYIHKKGLGLLI